MSTGRLYGRVRPSTGKVRNPARSAPVRVREYGPLYRAVLVLRTPGIVRWLLETGRKARRGIGSVLAGASWE